MKRKLKLSNNRLQTCCEFFNIPSKLTRLTPELLMGARIGNKEALANILEHNREDVISTELVWEKLHPYMFNTKTSI